MAAVFQPRREVMRKGQTTSRRGKCGKRAASPGVSDASSALACSDVGEEVTQNIVQYTAEEKITTLHLKASLMFTDKKKEKQFAHLHLRP